MPEGLNEKRWGFGGTFWEGCWYWLEEQHYKRRMAWESVTSKLYTIRTCDNLYTMLYAIGTFDSYLQQRFKGEGNWAYLGCIWVWGNAIWMWRQNKRRQVSKREQLQPTNRMGGLQDCSIVRRGAKRRFGSVVSLYVGSSLIRSCLHMSSDTPSWCPGDHNKMSEIQKEWTMLTCRPCREKTSLSLNMSFFHMSDLVPHRARPHKNAPWRRVNEDNHVSFDSGFSIWDWQNITSCFLPSKYQSP